MKEHAAPMIAWVLLLVLAIIWGSSFILIKIGLEGLTSGEVGALRILSASIVLIPLALKNLKNVQRKHLGILFLLGLFGSLLPAILFATAQTQLPSSVAGILNALTPLFTMLLGVIFFKQNLSYRTLGGLLIGLAGTGYLISGGSFSGLRNLNYHALLVVLATISYGANLNLIKYRMKDLSAKTITSFSLLLVGPLTAVYLFGFSDFTAKLTASNLYPVSAILLLGVLGTALALIFFNELVKITTPVFTSSVTYLIPIVAVFWGLLDDEVLQLHHLIGMLMIICGVYLANRRSVKQPSRKRG